MTSRASKVERLGRNPKLTGLNPASKTGSRTSLAAAMITRSAITGIESGLVFPGCPALGMLTRLSGEGRYVLVLSASASSSRKARTPAIPFVSMLSIVTASTPGAPLLVHTSIHACHITSLRVSLS
jgi:hypothetical protein